MRVGLSSRETLSQCCTGRRSYLRCRRGLCTRCTCCLDLTPPTGPVFFSFQCQLRTPPPSPPPGNNTKNNQPSPELTPMAFLVRCCSNSKKNQNLNSELLMHLANWFPTPGMRTTREETQNIILKLREDQNKEGNDV